MSTTKIHVEIAGQIISATLSDNSAANSLIKQLPLTLTFNDYNAVEKTGALPEALDLSRMPQGAEPQIGDIGYYAPNQVLVLYYGKVGYWPGIVRLGKFEEDPAVVEKLPNGTVATIKLAP